MNIGIASDHRGYELKEKLTKYFIEKKYNMIDYGTNSLDNVDYIDFAINLAKGITKKDIDFGILICGTGIGMSIACNKIKGIRCAKISNVEEALLSRKDVDANVISLSGKTDFELAKEIIDTFLKTEFNHIERYVRRINKIKSIEEGKL